MSLALHPIGRRDYEVRDDGQPVGRIRYASEWTPGIWIRNVIVNVPTPSGLPIGTAPSLDAARADFKAVWGEFKSHQTPEALAEALAEAYRAANLRNTETR